MQQSRELSNEEQANIGEAVNASLGMGEDAQEGGEQSELPEYAKKKLGMQEKRHKKELRKMQQQIEEMRSQFSANSKPQSQPDYGVNQDQSNGSNLGNDQIYAAVAKALQMQKEQEQRARDAEKLQHVHKQYRALEDHLDNASGKYEDFDDIVKSDDAPYTGAMRDAALLIPNAADTLYHLGKDRDKLKKIAELHPVDQAREVVKMSIALMGSPQKSSNYSDSKPLGNIKNNPVNSRGINEQTSVGDIRKQMKEGGKKWGK